MCLIKKCRCKELGRPAKEAWLKCAHPWVSKHVIVGFPTVHQPLTEYFRYAPKSFAEAQQMDKQVGLDIRNGQYNPFPKETRRKPSDMASETPTTLEELFAHYLTHHLKANRKAGASRDLPQLACLERNIARLGKQTPLADLDCAALQTWATWLKTRPNGKHPDQLLTDSTIFNEANTTWRMLRWASERGYYTLPCTWKQMGFPAPGKGRTSRLDPEIEEVVLAQPMPDILRCFIHLALDTGLRSRALRSIQLKHVDWKESDDFPFGCLRVPKENIKGGVEELECPLTPRARKALQDRRDLYFSRGVLSPDTYLVGGKTGSRVSRAYLPALWDKLREKVPAIEKVTLHDLRAEAGTRIYEATGRLDVVMRFLGHKKITTTQKYMRAQLNEKRAVMEILANVARGAAGTESVPQVKKQA